MWVGKSVLHCVCKVDQEEQKQIIYESNYLNINFFFLFIYFFFF